MGSSDSMISVHPKPPAEKWAAAWILGLVLIATLAIYGPLLGVPFNGEDQAYFFFEMGQADSWKEQLALIFDYSQNRLFHKADTFLFRPLMIGWLTLQYKVFFTNYFAWNLANLGIHLLNLFLFYRLLRSWGGDVGVLDCSGILFPAQTFSPRHGWGCGIPRALLRDHERKVEWLAGERASPSKLILEDNLMEEGDSPASSESARLSEPGISLGKQGHGMVNICWRGGSVPAALMTLFFAVRNPIRYEVGNNHMGGYLLATTLLLLALRELKILMSEKIIPQKSLRVFVLALTVGVFFYEMLAVFCVVISLFVMIIRFRKGGGWSGTLMAQLLFPAVLFGMVYGVRQIGLDRPMLVGEEHYFFQHLSLPRFLESFHLAWGGLNTYLLFFFPLGSHKWQVALLVLLSFIIFRRGFQWNWLREQSGALLMVFALFWIYNMVLGFFRMRCFGHYFYLGYLLLVWGIFLLIDWRELSGRRFIFPAALLSGWIGISSAIGVWNSRETSMEYKEMGRYFSRVNDFVSRHQRESGFSFRIENPPEGIDEVIGMRPGYFDSPEPEIQMRMSEYLYVPYYDSQNPRYILSVERDGRFAVQSAQGNSL